MGQSKQVEAARRWHARISTWMEGNGYTAVKSERTIFMKRTGDDSILHGLFQVCGWHQVGIDQEGLA
jgi:hypothetical protein